MFADVNSLFLHHLYQPFNKHGEFFLLANFLFIYSFFFFFSYLLYSFILIYEFYYFLE